MGAAWTGLGHELLYETNVSTKLHLWYKEQ